ncbi:MAG: hypothetical protein HYZ09_02705, partial [Candidatus Kerfeldbacteria bacterium]|nr:hypothetical protein [Candidatus Kerfeldbacteria bacterium]
GFIVYFAHRYRVSQRRAQLIVEHRLAAKVRGHKPLTEADGQALEYILSTLKSTKEKWNYIVIFAASGLALVVGLYLDFIA